MQRDDDVARLKEKELQNEHLLLRNISAEGN